MEKFKKVDLRDSVKVVTANEYVYCRGTEELSLNARKLMFIAIAQCRIVDKEFYTFSISVGEFAAKAEIVPNNLYEEMDNITDELSQLTLKSENTGRRRFAKGHVFEKCVYEGDAGRIIFQMSSEVASLFLNLKNYFTEVLLEEFMKMHSKYSMILWHLFLVEMKGRPGVTDRREFNFSLNDLRKITGTVNKFERINDFRKKVLDIAIRDIKNCCGLIIAYKPIKNGKMIVGFCFIAETLIHVDPESLPPEVIEKAEQIEIDMGIRIHREGRG